MILSLSRPRPPIPVCGRSHFSGTTPPERADQARDDGGPGLGSRESLRDRTGPLRAGPGMGPTSVGPTADPVQDGREDPQDSQFGTFSFVSGLSRISVFRVQGIGRFAVGGRTVSRIEAEQ